MALSTFTFPDENTIRISVPSAWRKKYTNAPSTLDFYAGSEHVLITIMDANASFFYARDATIPEPDVDATFFHMKQIVEHNQFRRVLSVYARAVEEEPVDQLIEYAEGKSGFGLYVSLTDDSYVEGKSYGNWPIATFISFGEPTLIGKATVFSFSKESPIIAETLKAIANIKIVEA
jgi:hypothetical protein